MAGAPSYTTTKVWTIPNVLSLLRLLGVPLFLWLVLGPKEDAWAVAVLMLGGLTDWLDGKIARATNQISRVGEMLDPLADRLYILATLIGLGLREIIPWWFVALLLLRDVAIAFLVPILRTRGFTSLPVHFLGKAATFCLLYAFPLVLLAEAGTWWQEAMRAIGWAFAVWGAGLYWVAAGFYFHQAIRLTRDAPKLPPADRPGRREVTA